jgi:hypothetical protein
MQSQQNSGAMQIQQQHPSIASDNQEMCGSSKETLVLLAKERWFLVFQGPVHKTEKKTETGLNWTAKDRTHAVYVDRSFAVLVAVF